MARKIIHILFALLFIGTLAAMMRLLWLEGNLEEAYFIIKNPVLMLFALAIVSPLFLCEYFFWRSTLFLVSYSGDEPVALGASIISAIASSATLLYGFCPSVRMPHFDNTILWFSLFVQFVCRLIVRILTRNTFPNDSQEGTVQ